MRLVPLLFFAVLVYALLALMGPSVLSAALLAMTLPSGAQWALTVADLTLALGLLLLFLEILKATRTSAAAALDHGLSVLVMVLALLGFLLVPALGTSDFFLLFLMTLTDVVAGFTVSLMGARRDIGYGGHGDGF